MQTTKELKCHMHKQLHGSSINGCINSFINSYTILPQDIASSLDVVLISVSGQGLDDLISTTLLFKHKLVADKHLLQPFTLFPSWYTTVLMSTVTSDTDCITRGTQPMHRDMPQEAEPPRRCGDEVIRALARDQNQRNIWGRGYQRQVKS